MGKNNQANLKVKRIKIQKIKILFELDSDIKAEFLSKCQDERKKMSAKIREFIEAYVKGRIS